MRAAIAAEPQSELTVETVMMREPGPREVVVRIEVTGLCHSDLNPLEGRTKIPHWPVVLGHEATGIVEEVGAQVRELSPGDRVIGIGLSSCGRCWWCVRGEVHLCANAATQMTPPIVRGDGAQVASWMGLGTFAEAMLISEDSAVRVNSDLPPEQLALIGCGVTAGICAVTNTAQVEPGASVAVVGAGGVGQSVVQGARISGANQIIVIDPVPMKRRSAQTLGATDVIDPGEGDVVTAVKELTGGRGVDYAFEVVGRAATSQQAYEMVRRGGALILVGAASPEVMAPWSLYDQLRNEKRVLGSLMGSAQARRDFPRIISMVESGLVRLDDMVSSRLTLDQVNDGLAALHAGTVIRSVIVN